MCLMFESPRRGYLITNGNPWTLEQVAVALRGDWQENLVYLKELVANGVMKRVEATRSARKCPRFLGAFFSARLVTDERHREDWRAQKRRQRIEKKRNLVRPMSGPSSSSSSSSSSNLNTKTPLPPAGAGDSAVTFLNWQRQTIAVTTGRHKRIFSKTEMESFQGLRAEDLVERLKARGFPARIVPQEEIESWQTKTATA